MSSYRILTDSCADLPQTLIESLGTEAIQLEVMFDGGEPMFNNKVDIKEFYAKLRAKQTASTSAVNIERFERFFEPVLAAGEDLIYLGFTSALSGTYNAAFIAARELAEKFPDRKIYTIDTLCASTGLGLLVYNAIQKKNEGADIDEIRDYVESIKLKMCHWFTVEDLFFLKRGGRLSAATAIAGTLLQIKPVLHADNNGKLVNVSKARGRRAAIDALFEKMKETGTDIKNQVVAICHGDCIEDAEYLAGKIREEFSPKDIIISYTGAVIGSHSGPGTLAIFYLGTER
jgi:DegV family protein with EDD domain